MIDPRLGFFSNPLKSFASSGYLTRSVLDYVNEIDTTRVDYHSTRIVRMQRIPLYRVTVCDTRIGISCHCVVVSLIILFQLCSLYFIYFFLLQILFQISFKIDVESCVSILSHFDLRYFLFLFVCYFYVGTRSEYQ